MSLLQLKVDPTLKRAIEAKADEYGVPASSLARIALVNAFLKHDWCPIPDRSKRENEMTLDQFIKMSGGSREISDEEYGRAMQDLSTAISKKFRGKKLPSIEEQLKDL
ncbi:hypothetical protein HY732_00545 [Candidatus Uhrbacteria bacterium]|nr:hypothetical protein [Candidatus Uhrbacteria bacterium]